MKIRVLMLVRDLSWFGGVVNFIDSLESNLSEDICVDNFRIGQRKGKVGKWLRPVIPFVDALRLAFRAGFDHYDFVHINPSLDSRSIVRDALFMLVLKLAGVRNVVVFMHGWDDKTASNIGKHGILKKALAGLIGRSKAIYVLDSRFKQTLVDWGMDAGRINVVTTMFDGSQFDGVERSRKADGKVQLLFLSRFIKEKGIYELLSAFRSLHERFPELRLVLTGDGPEMAAMLDWVEVAGLQNYVSFTGYVRDKKKAQVPLDADVFVLPSYREGCPVSLLEAMPAGLSVIASDVGGISNILVPGKSGYLLDVVTPESIETAASSLLVDSEKCISMGNFNRETAWECYEASAVSTNIENAYRRLVRQG